MAVQARWHSEIAVPDDDPFKTRVEQVGFPIELIDGVATLNERLVELVHIEGMLYNAGVTCSVKDRDDTTCLACPISAHDDETSALRPLCRCGREEERVSTALAVEREARRGEE